MIKRPLKKIGHLTGQSLNKKPLSTQTRGTSKDTSSAHRQQTAQFFDMHASSSSSEEVLIRKRKRRHTKRNKRLKIALIIVAALALLGGGTAWGVMSMIKAGENAIHSAEKPGDIETGDNAVSTDDGKTVKYNGHTYKLNDNIISICVLGFDRMTPSDEGTVGRANFIVVMAFDTKTGKTSAICLPRDSMVDVSQFAGDTFIGINSLQLCLAFSYGNGKDTSAQYTTDAASRLLYSIPISYYFSLDMGGIGPLSDAMGGVALTPLQSIPETNIIKGQDTVLFGSNALNYVKWRDTSVLTSSLDRQERDIQYLKAFTSQALNAGKGDIGTLVNLYNTMSDYSITNLGLSEYSYLASAFLSTKPTGLDVEVLTGEMKQGQKYAEYYLDKDSVYQTVLKVYYNQID